MHDAPLGAGLVALLVGGVLEGHPAVARLGQGPHHPAVELPCGDLALVDAFLFGLLVGGLELGAEQVCQVRHLVRVEQRPLPVLLHTFHEEVGDPVGQVQVVCPAGRVARVLPELQEVLDVGVPRLEVDAGRSLAATALVDRGDRAVEGLEPGDDAVRQAVGTPDEGTLRPYAVPCHAYATGELRELGDVGVALVDALEAVLRGVQQVAAGHLGVDGARVEQGRAGWQVLQGGDEPVEADGIVRAGRQPAGHSQEEVLGGLGDHAVLGVPKQIAVIDGAEAEELEEVVPVALDGVVQLAGVGRHELGHFGPDDSLLKSHADRL